MEGHHTTTDQVSQPQRLPIVLSRMPQQIELRDQDEDWTGQTNPATRRKLQNRLHQRAYRKRKTANKWASQSASSSSPEHQYSTDGSTTSDLSSSPEISHENPELWRIFDAAAGHGRFGIPERRQAVFISKASFHSPPEDLLLQLQHWANSNRIDVMPSHSYSPNPAADQLLVLEKFNVFRALLSNSSILGFATEANMNDNALSPFCTQSSPDLILVPQSLHPTSLQRQVPHHPWIDLLPDPRMRNNILRAGDSFDDMALCGDLVGLFSVSSGDAGMVVWGQPWLQSEWEVTEEFLKRWAWVVEGCCELRESTNRWRIRRGEKALRF